MRKKNICNDKLFKNLRKKKTSNTPIPILTSKKIQNVFEKKSRKIF